MLSFLLVELAALLVDLGACCPVLRDGRLDQALLGVQLVGLDACSSARRAGHLLSCLLSCSFGWTLVILLVGLDACCPAHRAGCLLYFS